MNDETDVIHQLFGVNRTKFVDAFLGKQHLHSAMNETGLLAKSLPCPDAFARLLSLSAVNSNDVQLTANGQPVRTPLLSSGALDLQMIWSQFYDGTSIVMNNLQKIDASVSDMCSALFTSLGHRLGANAYLTPPGAAAFATHFDTHDVIVVQVAGEKQWSLFNRPDEVPVQYHHQLKLEASVLEAKPLANTMLKAGDALYLPRGFPHRAKTESDVSLHVTFSLKPIDLAYVLQSAADMLRHSDEAFREQISPNLFLNVAAMPKPESLQRLCETISNPEFMARLMQAVRKEAIQGERLSITPLYCMNAQHPTAVRWRVDSYVEMQELPDESLVVTNGVKATKFVGDEIDIFRRVRGGQESATAPISLNSENAARIRVLQRLSALGLVEPINA